MTRLRLAVCLTLLSVGSAVALEPASSQGPVMVGGDCGRPLDLGGGFWIATALTQGWIRGADLPPLVTTSPPGTDRSIAGILGVPSTTTLFAGRVNEEDRFGFAISAGYRFAGELGLGIEAGFSMLESQASGFSATSDGSTILARPFINALNGTPQAVLVAISPSSAGAVAARGDSGNFYDARLDLTETLGSIGPIRLESLLGYRFLRYDEGVRISQVILPADPVFVPGTQITSTDGFAAKNEFHAADLGLRATFTWDRLSLGLLAKVAVGRLGQEVVIQGSQLTAVPGSAPLSRAGGVLALGSNSGIFSNAVWTAMPEVGASLSWQLGRGLRLYLGYSALDLRQTARAADFVSLRVDPALFPPTTTQPTRTPPTFGQNEKDIWIQRLNLGVELSF